METQAPPPPIPPDARPDEDLLRAFTRAGPGAKDALGELARRYERPLLGLAFGILNDRDGAMEAVQEAWLRVIRYGAGFKGRSTVRTWLYRIVINRCLDLRGARARTAVNGTLSNIGPSAPEQHHDDLNLRRAMNTLSDDQRLILLLCFHRGLTHEQTADVLGIPLGTLKSRQHAAMTLLRKALGSGEETP